MTDRNVVAEDGYQTHDEPTAELRPRIDLCHAGGNQGLTPDCYPREDYAVNVDPNVDGHHPADGTRWQPIPATYFVCASEADGIAFFPCTGSKHVSGIEIICSCSCHMVAVTS
jgi:hypothetical protein